MHGHAVLFEKTPGCAPPFLDSLLSEMDENPRAAATTEHAHTTTLGPQQTFFGVWGWGVEV